MGTNWERLARALIGGSGELCGIAWEFGCEMVGTRKSSGIE